MRFNRFFVASLLLAVSVSVHAGGKVVGNGGDPRALDFTTVANSAIDDVLANPARYPEAQSLDLKSRLKKALIVVSDTPVFAILGEVRQVSTAINYRDPEDTIVLYGPGWDDIKDYRIKRALALHEVLGLADIERTGTYMLSRRYLENSGVRCASEFGLCESIPQYSCTLIRNLKSEPQYLATGGIGQKGAQSEILNLNDGAMKATVVMNIRAAGGHILLLLYKDSRTVNSLELRGTSFSSTLTLEWLDSQDRNTWSIQCNRK